MSDIDKKLFGTGFFNQTKNPSKTGIMNTRFVIPPFSTFDTFGSVWQTRKKAWLGLGLKGEEGRRLDEESDDTGIAYRKSLNTFGRDLAQKYELKDKGLSDEHVKNIKTGTSVFDPVLCELMYRWHTFPNWSVLDPFAGGSTRGVVAASLDREYNGIEVRENQVTANIKQADEIFNGSKSRNLVNWIHGDSFKLNEILGSQNTNNAKYDYLFTCPPYYNLEVYSSDKADGSVHETYEDFMVWYEEIFKQALCWIKDNRFITVVVGDFRNKKTGELIDFVGDNVAMFKRLGLKFWNESIIINSPGSLRLRTNRPFCNSRKIGRRHQTVLDFYKGSLDKLEDVFKVPVGEIE